jgi:hypothetical protein
MLAKVRQWLGCIRSFREETNYKDPSNDIAVSVGQWDYGDEEVLELEGAESRMQGDVPDESGGTTTIR